MTASRPVLTPPLGASRGLLVSVEGLWGAGKTTLAAVLGERLTAAGYRTAVLHYGPRSGVVGELSRMLEDQPLRSRVGAGGYAAPHHATVDVLLRLCRERYHHLNHYLPALAAHDVVVIDHGVYSKIAYAVTVLAEQHPHDEFSALLRRVRAVCGPWFAEPDVALWLDIPWPLARERAIARGHGGGDPGSIERRLFLPHYARAYARVARAHPDRVRRIPVADRGPDAVAADALAVLSDVVDVDLEVTA